MTDERDREIAELEARLQRLKAEREASRQRSAAAVKRETQASKVLRWGAIIALGLFVLWCLQFCSDTPPETTASVASPDAPAAPVPTAEELAEAARQAEALRTPWRYVDDRDPMTDRLTRSACTTSSNRAMLDSPYRPVTARLCLRQSPQYGLDAYIALDGDGQILCRSYDGCTLKVRFDDGVQQSFSGASSADGSSNVVFVSNAQRFVNAVKSAETTRVVLTFYRAGDQVMEFRTEKLEWPRPVPTAG